MGVLKMLAIACLVCVSNLNYKPMKCLIMSIQTIREKEKNRVFNVVDITDII